MLNLTCAISGLNISMVGFGNSSVAIPHTAGYYHPIFAASYKTIYSLYGQHCKGELSPQDSYLLFLAILHSSDKIDWKHPATCKPTDAKTYKLIENNISQLVSVLEKTANITHPSFRQPRFSVNFDNSKLEQIPNWIEAWNRNIADFYLGAATLREIEELQALENKLTFHILSGAAPSQYSTVIANWAEKAAEFPLDKAEQWKQIIRTCFNPYKMFTTKLANIKEVRDYCYANIEAGSIHFHELCEALDTGITNHIDYLGLASPVSGFTLLPNTDGSVNSSITYDKQPSALAGTLAKIKANTPLSEPIESQYPSKVEYIKAKLAYRLSKSTQDISVIDNI